MDVIALAGATGGQPLAVLGMHILRRRGLVRALGLDEGVLARFLVAVEAAYHPVPFHNSQHAADVMHSVHVLLGTPALHGVFSAVEVGLLCNMHGLQQSFTVCGG